MATSVWQKQASATTWTTVSSISLDAGDSITVRYLMSSSYSSDKISISASSSDISISSMTLSGQSYTMKITASSGASGAYTVSGSDPGSSATLTVNVTESSSGDSGGSGGSGSVYWSKTSSGSSISSVSYSSGKNNLVYFHMGGEYSSDFQLTVTPSGSLYVDEKSISGEIVTVSIDAETSSAGGYTIKGTSPAGSATLNVTIIDSGGGGDSGGGDSGTQSISGSSSISTPGTVTYTATGFSNPDAIVWSLTNTQYCDFNSQSGNVCKVEFYSTPAAYTTVLTAVSSGQSASKTISVSANVSYSGYRTAITISQDGKTWDNVKYPEEVSQSEAMLTSSGASHCKVTITWITTGKIQVEYAGQSIGTDTVSFYNSAGLAWTTTVTVTTSDLLEIEGPNELAVGETAEYRPVYKGTLQRFGLGIHSGCELEYTEEDELLTIKPTSRSSDSAYFYVTGRTEGGAQASLMVSVKLPPLKLILYAPEEAEMGKVVSISAGLNMTGYTDTYTWTVSGVDHLIFSEDETLTLKPNSTGTLTVSCRSSTYSLTASAAITIINPVITYVKLTYDAMGGTSDMASTEVIAGRSVILPDAYKDGTTLEGWYSAKTDGTRVGGVGDRYIVEGDTTLYANWVGNASSVSDCHLMVYHDGIRDMIRFEVVDSIEDTITANLNSTSTVVFGADNRFIMDLGTSRKFTLNISRANPVGYDDSSDDQTLWSNGKWLREFLNMIDFWQNFGRDPYSGKSTGGMRFYFSPSAEVKETYPTIDSNVFIVGTISPRYVAPQLLKLSIPLQVAGMDVASAGQPTEFVTYQSTIKGMDSVEQEFIKGARVSVISMPSEWEEYTGGQLLVSWQGSDGKTYYPGELVKLTSGMTLTANWKKCLFRISSEDSYWDAIGYGRLMIYAVGGGGAGASCARDTTIHVGGGGGAGYTRLITIPVRQGDEISWTIGAGGKPDSSGKTRNGGNGGETVVSLNGLEILRAEGGSGGKAPNVDDTGGPYTAYGGQGWGSGGTSDIPKWVEDGEILPGVTIDIKGGDGATTLPNTSDYIGKGHYGGDTLSATGKTVPWMGGSGGGASGLHIRLGSSTLISRGGNGGYISGTTYSDVEPPGSGTLGGGGGSGPNATGGAGGSGVVILAFYST